MNAVEIEAALSDLVLQPFDVAEFPYDFLAAFGHKETTLKRLRTGNNNASDVPGGVLQRNHIHLAVSPVGSVGETFQRLRTSSATAKAKARFILATDGQTLEAEELASGETIACAYPDFANYFGFFLPLAGISTIQEIKDNPVDVRATGRLNKLYVELLRENPDWATDERRAAMNHFMARLIFCFFAEDTAIFNGEGLFTQTVEQMSERDGSNTAQVLSEIFRAMNTPIAARRMPNRRSEFSPTTQGVGLKPDLPADSSLGRSEFIPTEGVGLKPGLPAGSSLGRLEFSPTEGVGLKPDLPASLGRSEFIPTLRPWADQFPYVNGGLFSGSTEVPRFTRMARTYLLHAGGLNWKKINPDIFGSMIQAVADDAERSALGMHYTSVPNILKVLNPLFLDALRAQLAEAGDNERKLLNLRKRMARIRVFDPACGSGNFLVIAYKQMREIEADINRRRGESHLGSEIPLTNFRGIELRDFPAEIARLALIIAEFQCDVLYRGQKDALAEFLPLDAQNWIICGNALRLDWLSICPPTGTGVKLVADDLFGTPLDQAEIDFENAGGETYICGNPPYLGSTWQTVEQKADLQGVFFNRTKHWKSLDYVAGWFMKAADYGTKTPSAAAFVSTNSICQGQQVAILWTLLFATGHEIAFAHTSFKWSNLASYNAGVTVAIVGLARPAPKMRRLFGVSHEGAMVVKDVPYINAYLVSGAHVVVGKMVHPLCGQSEMSFGNKPVDGGHLLLTREEVHALGLTSLQRTKLIRRIYGSAEFIRGLERYCLWITDEHLEEALRIKAIEQRIEGVRAMRLSSTDSGAQKMAQRAHQMREMKIGVRHTIGVAAISSENRPFLPCGLLSSDQTVTNKIYALYDAPLWNMALLASRLHWVWIGTVCVRMRTDFSYSNTLGWNTFPVPPLLDNQKAELTECAENILLAREVHFPATIADLYDPDTMPENLRHAHERNDEVLERIYIGRRFKNDTERLEKLFEMYTKMTPEVGRASARQAPSRVKTRPTG